MWVSRSVIYAGASAAAASRAVGRILLAHPLDVLGMRMVKSVFSCSPWEIKLWVSCIR